MDRKLPQKEFISFTKINVNTLRDYTKKRGERPIILNLGEKINAKRTIYSFEDCLIGCIFSDYIESGLPIMHFPQIADILKKNHFSNLDFKIKPNFHLMIDVEKIKEDLISKWNEKNPLEKPQ